MTKPIESIQIAKEILNQAIGAHFIKREMELNSQPESDKEALERLHVIKRD